MRAEDQLPKQYADINTARSFTHRLYHDAHDVTFIEHSADSIVAGVDKEYAVSNTMYKA